MRRQCSAVLLALALCAAACGSNKPSNPYRLVAQVNLFLAADGGAHAQLGTVVYRPLDDGGVDLVADAGILLNGTDLGAPPAQDSAQSTVLMWDLDAGDGVGPLLHQNVSVIGADPPASVSFDCPVAISITSPEENAVLDPSNAITLAWTAGGSELDIQLSGALAPADAPAGLFTNQFYIGAVPAGTTSAVISSMSLDSLGIDGGVVALFTVQVPGASPDGESACYVARSVDVQLP